MMHHRRGATTTATPSNNNHSNNGGQLNINRQLGQDQQQVHINFKSVKQSLLNIFAIITFILFLYGCGNVGFILGVKTEKYVRWSHRPDNWETMLKKPNGNKPNMQDHFECTKSHEGEEARPLYTLADWRYVQKKLKEWVDPNANFDDPVPPTEGYTLGLLGNNTGPTPFYAKRTTDKGRSLFASRDIKEGELVHDGDNSRSDIIFPDSLSFRKFVFSLPRFMACDILEWSWTQRLEDGKLYHIFSPNISVYMNGVYGTGHANIKPLNGQSRKMYALEDIKKDDEIIYQKVRVC